MPNRRSLLVAGETEAQQVLRQEIVRAGLSEDALRDIAWLLNASTQWASLPSIAENLMQILLLIATRWKAPLSTWGIESWPPVLAWIVEHRRELADKIKGSGKFDRGARPDGTNPLLWECALRHPVYTSLWTRHQDPENQDQYGLLQGHVLIAHVLAMREYSTREGYEQYAGPKEWSVLPNSCYPVSRALREFALRRSADFLQDFPVWNLPAEFASAVSHLSPPDHSNIIAHHKALGHFLLYVARHKWRPREGGSGGKRSLKPPVEQSQWKLDFDDSEDPESDLASVIQVTECTLSTDEEKEQREAGDCLGENETEDLLLVSFQPEEEEDTKRGRHHTSGVPYRDPGNLLEAAKAQAKHIAMRNQLLPWAPNLLSLEDVIEITRQCVCWVKTLPDGDLSEEQLTQLESIALLYVMLFTGSSLERALRLRVFPAGACNDQAELALFLHASADSSHSWRLEALEPEYKTYQAGVPGKERKVADFISLPDVAGASYFLLLFLAKRGRLFSSSELRSKIIAFPRGEQNIRVYRARLRALLTKLDPTGRLTSLKVTKWLFSAVVTQTGGDIAAATLITGNSHVLGRVRGYYACPSLQSLQQTYVRVASNVASPIRLILGDRSLPPGFCQPLRIALSNIDIHAGSRLCPTRTTVCEAIGNLTEALQRAAKYRDLPGWIRYHNLYTLYSVWSFSFATGVRGITSPYLPPEDIDLKSGVASLTDKDDGSGYKTRLVWIPSPVLEQMRHYADHLAIVRREIKDPTLALANACFFLNEETRAVEVRPGTIREHMNQFLPFPVNVHRCFIRSELLERHCPPEIVDSWMGHWHRGEEPWGEFSSLSPEEYYGALTDHLVPLLSELGFRSQRSCLS